MPDRDPPPGATPAADLRGRVRAWGLALAIFAASLAGMVAIEPRLAIVWDEAYTLSRLDRVRAWFSALRDPVAFARTWHPERLRPIEDRLKAPRPSDIANRGGLLNGRVVAWFWPFAREEPHGHPPVYAEIALLGDLLTPHAGDLFRARLGTMLLFSLAAAGLFLFVERRWGLPAGLVSVLAWTLHPHLFALGHYATYDSLLSSLWLGTVLLFATTTERSVARSKHAWGLTIATGVVWGMALGTKFTGWFLMAPLVAWCCWRRTGQAWRTLAVASLVSLGTFLLLTPPLWSNPIGGLARFFASNLNRARTIPIKSLFLGHIYETPSGSLPWYNVIVWIVFATPVTFLILQLLGACWVVRDRRAQPSGLLLLLSAGTVLVLRSLPHTPGHDGTRQLAVGLGGLAALAGPGLAFIGRSWKPAAVWSVAGLVLAEGVIGLWLILPVPLSYYSPVVGGLPGAVALGMEPTYYWDSLTDGVLQALDERTPVGRSIFFASNPITWQYRESGRLKSLIFPNGGRNVAWYVIQNRPGSMSEVNRALARRLGTTREYILMSKFGVPLVWAFPASEVRAQLGGKEPAAAPGAGPP